VHCHPTTSTWPYGKPAQNDGSAIGPSQLGQKRKKNKHAGMPTDPMTCALWVVSA
jgi:hypothetical protein